MEEEETGSGKREPEKRGEQDTVFKRLAHSPSIPYVVSPHVLEPCMSSRAVKLTLVHRFVQGEKRIRRVSRSPAAVRANRLVSAFVLA